MTNPTPDYGSEVKLDSFGGEEQLSIAGVGRLTLVTRTTEAVLQDALLKSSSPSVVGKKIMDTTTPSKVPVVSKDEESKQQERKRQQLTFKVDDQNKIVEETYSYPFPSDVDDEEVWWSDDELDKLLTEAMLIADHYTRKRKDWQNKIKLIMKSVAGGTSKKDGQPVKLVKASDLDFVVDSDARGLELYIHPIFQKNREKAIKGVVKVQEDYNASEQKKGKTDPELRLKVLKAQSLKLTQTARLMAKTLADGDRRAATREGHGKPIDASVRARSPVRSLSPSASGGITGLRAALQEVEDISAELKK